MAVVKLSRSRKAWIFLDDWGNSYMIPVTALAATYAGTHKSDFGYLMMNRLPMPTKMGRFSMSPVLGKDFEEIKPNDERWTPPQCSHNIIVSDERLDPLSTKNIKKADSAKVFKDKKIDW